MRVLLVATDLYASKGGGQTFYRRIIEQCPDIHFTYFCANESPSARRPVNATAVNLGIHNDIEVTRPPALPRYNVSALEEAIRFLRPLAGNEFDVIDFPDYYTFGSMLRAAADHFEIRCKAFVLAMHGNISTTIEEAWGSPGDNAFEQRQLERDQFESADFRYAISRPYIRLWQQRVDRVVHYIDPLSVLEFGNEEFTTVGGASLPDLVFVGRRERLKGPDLFVEVCSWVQRSLYRDIRAIGDPCVLPDGTSADRVLQQIAANRGLSVSFEQSMSPSQLRRLYSGNAYLILPSRYDTLNLVALEAIAAGCPVAVSSAAGVCEYLNTTHPDVPYLELDIADLPRSVGRLQKSLETYSAAKEQAQRAAAVLRQRQTPFPIRGFYRMAVESRTSARVPDRESPKWTENARVAHVVAPDRLASAKAWVRRNKLERVARPLYRIYRATRSSLLPSPLPAPQGESTLSRDLLRLRDYPERSLDQIGEKLSFAFMLAERQGGRCNIWQELARLERIRGNDLVAASYELRLLRLLDTDSWGYLPNIERTLRLHKMDHVADAVVAQYGSNDNVPALLQFLDARENRLRKPPEDGQNDIERVVDTRPSGANPLVSIVVSMYKAAPKLRTFLHQIERQTIAPHLELIFVDANSPTNELEAIEGSIDRLKQAYVYVRTRQRETIQAAWNRALRFARGKYITCLGVDEGLFPDAIQLLARELDADQAIDWVMADSLVTQVDKNGRFASDVMKYDRSGGRRDLTYLDTTYVSWVGGLYRRDIHERCGYFDPCFTAAGDTEFKMRIFRRIRVKFLHKTLGIFFDYPEQRTTASPVAEIEDALAWYAFRSQYGVEYLLGEACFDEGMNLIRDCMGYRKAYRTDGSTDFMLGEHLANYMVNKYANNNALMSLASDLAEVNAKLRQVEYAEDLTAARKNDIAVESVKALCRNLEVKHSSAMASVKKAHYTVFNDNRYEQHSWVWKTR
jgi:glycosyltransferase involved in cell wall biosynthesis